jgi:hypothetical protein
MNTSAVEMCGCIHADVRRPPFSRCRPFTLQDTKKIVENEGRKCLLIRGDLEAEEHCLEV